MFKSAWIVAGGLAAGALFSTHPAAAQPGGSYQESCTRIEQRGPILRALCRDVGGNWVRSAINVGQCNGPIANSNGRLTCGGGGRPRYERRDRDRRDEREHRDEGRDPRVPPGYGGYGRPPY